MMRGRAVMLLLAALPVTACARSDDEALHAIEVFEQACIETNADRARFQALADDAGWAQLVTPAAPEEGRDWVVGYQASPSINGILSGTTARRGPPPGATITGSGAHYFTPEAWRCEVYANPYPNDWRDRLEAIEIEGSPLGSHSRSPDLGEAPAPPGVDILSWGRPMEGRMFRAVHDPSRGLVTSFILINHDSLRALESD